MKIQVNSEIGKLRAVMMQSPGKGIERCTPLNIGSLAWDSVPSPHKAAEEHQKWVEVVERFGAKVYLFEDLLRDVLAIPAVKKDLIAQIVKTEQSFITQQTMSVLQEYLLSLPPAKLVDQLFFGMTKEELNKIDTILDGATL